MTAEPALRSHSSRDRLRAGGMVGRALWRTVRAEVREGTLIETVRRSRQAGTLQFAGEPTFAELLERRAQQDPGLPFLSFEGQHISLARMNARANAVAAGLASLGLRPGDIVAVVCPNMPAYLDAFFATQKLGLGMVPVNTALVGDGLAHVLHHSGARAAIVHRDLLPAVEAVRPRVPNLVHTVVIRGRDRSPLPRTLPVLESWHARFGGAGAPGVTPDPETVSLLMYTSGTTGLPKGVVYRYRESNTKRLRLLGHLLYEPDDVLFACLPLFHANALLLGAVQALNVGARFALAPRFSASRFWEQVAESGASTFNALGAMIPILLKQPPGPHDQAHRVRLVVSAACPTHAWEPFEERFGVRIVEAYGAVDGGGFITMNLGNAPVGSIGRPIGGARYRLVDGEGHDVADGSPGELLVWTGKARSVEYYRDPQATDEKTQDGWIRTGDLMMRDASGYLYFAGRNTDSMRRRGENVSAFEVETVLDRHPNVLECAVFGVPSDLGEDDIMAVVVPVEGRTIDPAALHAWLRDHLARHALPRYIDVLSELPKTGTHRVQKGALKARGVSPAAWDAEATPDPAIHASGGAE
jgi:carnitine-CoA ligase